MGRASRRKRERKQQPEPELIVYAGLASASGDSQAIGDDVPISEDRDQQ